MKEEIKKILDRVKNLKSKCNFCLKIGKNMYIPRHDKQTDNLIEAICLINDMVDYITNLQEQNKEWEMIFDTFSKRPYAHKYLEEKKKELNNNKIIGLDSEIIYKDYYDLKLRIDKAIEYLEQPYRDNFDYSKAQLLNILKGDKDE